MTKTHWLTFDKFISCLISFFGLKSVEKKKAHSCSEYRVSPGPRKTRGNNSSTVTDKTMDVLVVLGLWWLLAFGPNQVSGQTDRLRIYSLHAKSEIRFRFATTQITSRLANNANYSREASFHVILPDQAFISNFTVEIGGKIYPGEVKDKETAKKQYDRAKKRGQSAGHVAAKPRNTNQFKVSINVAAYSKATFNLTYQELLKRTVGLYKHVIYVSPGQPVDSLRVQVYIDETREITHLRVPPIRSDLLTDADSNDVNDLAVITRPTPETAYISYAPSREQQVELSPTGVRGLFSVLYDVKRNSGDAGDVLVVNGYFVHFFAPEGMELLPKDVMFILDVSSSMSGKKIQQLKNAMEQILNDLHEDDRFNVMKFSSSVQTWKNKLIPATKANLEAARHYVKRFRASGWTNINGALVGGIETLKKSQGEHERERTPIIIFLTDGEATTGITKKDVILSNVQTTNEGKIPVFSLSFGQGADYKLLQKLAAQNNAVARKIYEASDAELQLKGFYDEISAAVMNNLTFSYVGGGTNSSLTRSTFSNYFNGSERVVAGRLGYNHAAHLSPSVSGSTAHGPVLLKHTTRLRAPPSAPAGDGLLSVGDIQALPEKIWAYLTIKQLLEKTLVVDNAIENAELKREALELSLKYKFVTPLTSMVVTAPKVPKDEASEAKKLQRSAKAFNDFKQNSMPRRRQKGYGGGGGDPHFIMDVAGLDHPLCFNIMGEVGDMLTLINDSPTGVDVRAEIVLGNTHHKNTGRLKTYMGRLFITAPGVKLVVTPDSITLNDYRLPWYNETVVHAPHTRLVTTGNGKDLVLSLENHIRFFVKRIILHQNSGPVKYLDFFVLQGSNLSKQAGGVLGQLVHVRGLLKKKWVNKKGQTKGKIIIHAYRSKVRRIVATLAIRHDLDVPKVPCWVVWKNVSNLVRDGQLLPPFVSGE